MAQTQQNISEKAFSIIRTAEHPASVAGVAAVQFLAYLRREGGSLVSSLSKKVVVAKDEARDLWDASKSVRAKVSDSVASALKASKAEIAAMNAELAERAKPAPMSAEDLVALEKVARDREAEIATLTEAPAKAVPAPGAAPAPNTPASAPAAPASISKRSQGAHKAWATRRAKAAGGAATAAPVATAPVSPALLVAAHQARAHKAWVTRRAKIAVSASTAAAVAPAPNTSASVATASISKRSQGALKAWVTRRANAAAGAQTAAAAAPALAKARKAQARRAPRETVTTRVVEILKSCSGMSLDAQALGERLASDWAYQNKGYDWHNCLSGQLRTEVLSQMESMRKSGVTVISVPFGTRLTHRFVWTGNGGVGKHIQPTYSFLMSAPKFEQVREIVSDLIDPATWSVTGGRRKGAKSVRVWVEDERAAIMFKLAN
jgi:hypothetical protein